MREHPAVPRLVLKAVLILGAWFVALHASSAEAAVTNPAGFWSGLIDGFLGLIKLLASLVVNVTLFDREARSLSYDIGFFLGVFAFAGLAGAVDSASDAELTGGKRSILAPDVNMPSSPKSDTKRSP